MAKYASTTAGASMNHLDRSAHQKKRRRLNHCLIVLFLIFMVVVVMAQLGHGWSEGLIFPSWFLYYLLSGWWSDGREENSNA